MHKRGDGVPRSNKFAVKWFSLAAEQGHPGAQVALGVMHVLGRGIDKSKILAYMWWEIAASQGAEEARVNLKVFKKRMSRPQISEAMRLAKEWKENHKK
jgi:hypothetical protein